ncbi:hypothetical protein B0H13DRAFT_1591773 [Mycena leptocephala]|nr:hypothetical protein B0H13DRAFT_1591773 [Mycena leptocephala]
MEVEEIRPAKIKWQRATQALLQRAQSKRKQTVPIDLINRVLDGLGAIYWSGNLMGFDNREEITHLSLYATKEWFTDIQVSQMLDLLRRDVLAHGTILHDEVPEIWVMENIKDAYRRRHLYTAEPANFRRAHTFGEVLQTRSRNRIGMMGNLQNWHWVGVVLDVKQRRIRYGDPKYKTDPDPEIKAAHQWWTHYHTGTSFAWGDLEMSRQHDGHNCGMLSFNGIAHDFLPDKYPLISTTGNDPANARLELLLRVIDRHLEASISFGSPG